MSKYNRFLRAYYIMFFWALRLVACLGAAVNSVILAFVLIDLADGGRDYGFAGLALVAFSLCIAFAMWKIGSAGLLRLRQAKAS
ncbi:TPA: hypothetical protein UOJ25_000437 [Stenotrophomonas maltophilia]|nr:hypothetical protein [Stenotrophomonas maltophilia]